MTQTSSAILDSPSAILDPPGVATDSLSVLALNEDALAVLDDLSRPLEERLLGPMAAAGYEAPAPVLTKFPLPLEVRYTDRGTTLTAAPYQYDPLLVEDDGRLRAPREERRKLKKIGKHGAAPHMTAVLRELPGIWRPGEPPPRMIGQKVAETARTRHMQHLQVSAAAFAFGRAALYTAGAAAGLATGAVVALGAITIGAIALAPLAQGLDPLVLGGVVHEPTRTVAWVPLAAWDEVPDGRGW